MAGPMTSSAPSLEGRRPERLGRILRGSRCARAPQDDGNRQASTFSRRGCARVLQTANRERRVANGKSLVRFSHPTLRNFFPRSNRGRRNAGRRIIHPRLRARLPPSEPLPSAREARRGARLSAFHRGSCQRALARGLSSRPGFLGRGSGGRYPPLPVPVQWKHPTHRP